LGISNIIKQIVVNSLVFLFSLPGKSFIKTGDKFMEKTEFERKIGSSRFDYECKNVGTSSGGGNLLLKEVEELEWLYEEDFCETIININSSIPISRRNINFCS
jgi:hypothetical protein